MEAQPVARAAPAPAEPTKEMRTVKKKDGSIIHFPAKPKKTKAQAAPGTTTPGAPAPAAPAAPTPAAPTPAAPAAPKKPLGVGWTIAGIVAGVAALGVTVWLVLEVADK
jgi:hypothetical protein